MNANNVGSPTNGQMTARSVAEAPMRTFSESESAAFRAQFDRAWQDFQQSTGINPAVAARPPTVDGQLRTYAPGRTIAEVLNVSEQRNELKEVKTGLNQASLMPFKTFHNYRVCAAPTVSTTLNPSEGLSQALHIEKEKLDDANRKLTWRLKLVSAENETLEKDITHAEESTRTLKDRIRKAEDDLDFVTRHEQETHAVAGNLESKTFTARQRLDRVMSYPVWKPKWVDVGGWTRSYETIAQGCEQAAGKHVQTQSTWAEAAASIAQEQENVRRLLARRKESLKKVFDTLQTLRSFSGEHPRIDQEYQKFMVHHPAESSFKTLQSVVGCEAERVDELDKQVAAEQGSVQRCRQLIPGQLETLANLLQKTQQTSKAELGVLAEFKRIMDNKLPLTQAETAFNAPATQVQIKFAPPAFSIEHEADASRAVGLSEQKLLQVQKKEISDARQAQGGAEVKVADARSRTEHFSKEFANTQELLNISVITLGETLDRH